MVVVGGVWCKGLGMGLTIEILQIELLVELWPHNDYGQVVHTLVSLHTSIQIGSD